MAGRLALLALGIASVAAASVAEFPEREAAESAALGPEFAQTADLKDTLEKGLRARRPEEFHYIALVVEKVEQGKLPLDLVIGTFQWARQRAKHKNYPFPYFVRALRERAKKLGLDAP